ncbi:hypothetical protein [Burkholderia cenocepacia]|uniref:hypothetical protein n=1 Tax=Burkholderia cenocepacia TaxID=95486 RepID=UPI0015C30AE3|nr:hypothetical protein [Burkholderia cenocepacia]
MATHNEKSPLTGNASGQRCAKRETGASTDTPSDVIGANAVNFSAGGGHADSLTDCKRQAVGEALTEYFAALDRDMGIDTPDRILSLFDYHDSRNIDDLIDRAIAPTIAAFHVDQRAPITAQTALAAIETFEIVGENNDSREPNAEDRFILHEFIAHAFGGFTVEQSAAAPHDSRFTHPGCEVCACPPDVAKPKAHLITRARRDIARYNKEKQE